MALFNFNKKRYTHSVQGGCHDSFDIVNHAIYMGIGYPLKYDEQTNKFVYANRNKEEIIIELIPATPTFTKINVETTMYLSSKDFAKMNLDPWSNRSHAQNVLDKIYDNISKIKSEQN